MMAAKVGLTGGIGGGKTTVADAFAALGVTVLDADVIARRISEPGTAQFARIVEQFGAGVVDERGRLDRAQLGRIVFASKPQRELLESILHPPIRAEMHDRAARDAGRYCILDIPLLVESGQYREMERVLVVSCSRDVRVRRLRRRGMKPAEIERVMRTQASERQRRAVADDVIDNNGDPADIEPQVRRLHDTYMALFG